LAVCRIGQRPPPPGRSTDFEVVGVAAVSLVLWPPGPGSVIRAGSVRQL